MASSTDSKTHEQQLVGNFVLEVKRPRLLHLLGHPKRRAAGLRSLSHFQGLDPRWCTRIAGSRQRADLIEKLLRGKGAPEICYVISEDSSIDGAFLPLAQALAQIVDSFSGCFLSCIPGKLAYFQTEVPGERFILQR